MESFRASLAVSLRKIINAPVRNRVITFHVGGFKYSISVSDLHKHPGSLLQNLAMKQNTSASGVVSIARDGSLFKFVNAFLINGHLPRNKHGFHTLDPAIVDQLKNEAEFYGLTALQAECKEANNGGLASDMPVYMKLHSLVVNMEHAKLDRPLQVVTYPQIPHYSDYRIGIQTEKLSTKPKDVKNEGNNDADDDDDGGGFWNICGRNRPQKDRFLSDKGIRRILPSIDKEIQITGTILVALDQLYTARESNPNSLKAGDRELYDTLVLKYSVEVVSAVVYRKRHEWDASSNRRTTVKAALFTPDIIAKHISETWWNVILANLSGLFKRKTATQCGPKLLLSHKIYSDQVMFYRPGTDFNGQDEVGVYLLSALQVRKG